MIEKKDYFGYATDFLCNLKEKLLVEKSKESIDELVEKYFNKNAQKIKEICYDFFLNSNKEKIEKNEKIIIEIVELIDT